MQLLQGQVLQQGARLAIRAGLSCQLLNALRERGPLIGLGGLEHLLEQPHALGPYGMLHTHNSGQQICVIWMGTKHSRHTFRRLATTSESPMLLFSLSSFHFLLLSWAPSVHHGCHPSLCPCPCLMPLLLGP